ncbi:alpha/beta hydrolase [Streptomyces sp. NPDC014746]|uniref:alpha/beta hydrolase n=1 Tax=Streptomyces sp. NPDC014746 TaxID=3364904 RepID=UPI0036F7F421
MAEGRSLCGGPPTPTARVGALAVAPGAGGPAAPALMVNATDGPRTLYQGARSPRAQWRSSRLLTVKGARQHGLYGEYGNARVDTRVTAYLRTGRLPAHDPTCDASTRSRGTLTTRTRP